MDKHSEDRAAVRIPPPLFFVACLGVGFLLEYLVPLQAGKPAPGIRYIVGGAALAVSGYFALSGFLVLIRNKTPFDPAKPTLMIVKEGAFRFSRNPLYFSLLLLLLGISVLAFSIWLLLAVPVLYGLFLFHAVKPEETYLESKFGKEYTAYKESVRRWI